MLADRFIPTELTSQEDFEKNFGQKAARRRKLYNGMIPCQLYMYYEQNKPASRGMKDDLK